MQFKPIVAALEAQIKGSAANTLIKLYRSYVVEPGAMAVPICLIGSSRKFSTTEEYLGNNQLLEAVIGISVLSRRFPLPAQIIRAAESIDATQDAICIALNADRTQGDVIVQSWITNVAEITLGNEYFGYEIFVTCQVFETSSV
jgi:hypothetical protein